MSSTQLPLTLGLKVVLIDPSDRLILTRRFWVAPLTVWNLPPTKTAVPPGAAVTVVTSPPANTGAKLVSTTPVAGSNDSNSLRFSVVPLEDLTDVNVPPTTILLPTVAMPLTTPLRMLGVLDAGVAETTTDWAALTCAPAAETAARAARGANTSAAKRTRRNTGDLLVRLEPEPVA